MQIIDGKKVSAQVKQEVKNETELLKKEHSITPGLAVVIVGDDPASRVYVNNKKKACELVGFHSEEYALPAETTQEELLDLVKTLNEKKDINGILVQLPLPKHLDDKAVIEAISPLKDVDAFHAVNVGKIMLGEYDFLPCTPAGVMEMLHYYNIEVSGKNCDRQKQYCRQTYGNAFTSRKRHCNNLPQPHKESCRGLQQGGYSCCSGRQTEVCYGRYGKRGRCGN